MSSILFWSILIVNLLLLYVLFDTRFLMYIQYFGNHKSPYGCFFFEVNNHFFQKMISMKPLTIGISYDTKIIFLVFCYQKNLFSFTCFWGTLAWKSNLNHWLRKLIKLNKSSIKELLLCKRIIVTNLRFYLSYCDFSNSGKDFWTGYSNYFNKEYLDSSGNKINIKVSKCCKNIFHVKKLVDIKVVSVHEKGGKIF